MFAALITCRNGVPLVDIVGVADTKTEAVDRLRANWILHLRNVPEMGDRVAAAQFDDVVNGDDPNCMIRYYSET